MFWVGCNLCGANHKACSEEILTMPVCCSENYPWWIRISLASTWWWLFVQDTILSPDSYRSCVVKRQRNQVFDVSATSKNPLRTTVKNSVDRTIIHRIPASYKNIIFHSYIFYLLRGETLLIGQLCWSNFIHGSKRFISFQSSLGWQACSTCLVCMFITLNR